MLVNIGYLKVGSVCIGNSPFNIVCIRFCAAYCTGLLLGRRMLHKFNVSRMAWSLPCLFWRWTRQDLQWTQNLWRHEGKNSLNNFKFHDDKLYPEYLNYSVRVIWFNKPDNLHSLVAINLIKWIFIFVLRELLMAASTSPTPRFPGYDAGGSIFRSFWKVRQFWVIF